MLRYAIAAVPLALAACNSGDTVTAENASIAEVAKATKDVVKLDPGKWENRVTLVSADSPGLPPQMAEMMKKQLAASAETAHTSCITKEMAERPTGDIFAGKDNGQCRYETFEMRGGKIDAVMVCKGAAGQPGEMRMTMSGNFSRQAYDMASEMKMSMPAMAGAPGQGGMTIKTKVAGKRIGACDTTKG